MGWSPAPTVCVSAGSWGTQAASTNPPLETPCPLSALAPWAPGQIPQAKFRVTLGCRQWSFPPEGHRAASTPPLGLQLCPAHLLQGGSWRVWEAAPRIHLQPPACLPPTPQLPPPEVGVLGGTPPPITGRSKLSKGLGEWWGVVAHKTPRSKLDWGAAVPLSEPRRWTVGGGGEGGLGGGETEPPELTAEGPKDPSGGSRSQV